MKKERTSTAVLELKMSAALLLLVHFFTIISCSLWFLMAKLQSCLALSYMQCCYYTTRCSSLGQQEHRKGFLAQAQRIGHNCTNTVQPGRFSFLFCSIVSFHSASSFCIRSHPSILSICLSLLFSARDVMLPLRFRLRPELFFPLKVQSAPGSRAPCF